MKKTDARVRYTKRILKEVFLQLLAEKPVNKVTVKEVCERAEVNRATFYAHYSDCFELLESIEDELIDSFHRSIAKVDSADVHAVTEAIYDMIGEQEEACRVLIFRGNSSSLLDRMIRLAREKTLASWGKRLPRVPEKELEMMYDHLCYGLLNVVVGGYDKYDKDEVIRFVDRIVPLSLSLYGKDMVFFKQ